MQRRKCLLQLSETQRTLRRLAYEILEKNEDVNALCLVGIAGESCQVARLLHRELCAVTGSDLPYGAVRLDGGDLVGLDGVQDKIVVLAVDVLFSGESIRQALTVLCGAGRPRCVQLAALVNRGHRRYPIRANFVGKSIPTSLSEYIEVELLAPEEEGGVYILEAAEL